VRHFEKQLQNAFQKLKLIDSPTASDVFMRQAFTPDLSQFYDDE